MKGTVPIWVRERLITVITKNSLNTIVVPEEQQEESAALEAPLIYDFFLGELIPPATHSSDFVGMVMRIEDGGSQDKGEGHHGRRLAGHSAVRCCQVARPVPG